MIYAYQYTDTKKNLHDQELQQAALEHYFTIAHPGREKIVWVEEVDGHQLDWEQRDIAQVIQQARRGDTFITDEIIRLGSGTPDIMYTLAQLLQKKITVLVLKQGYEFKDDLHSSSLAQAFFIAAQTSLEVAEFFSLSKKRKTSKKRGRPVGSVSVNKKLEAADHEIRQMLKYKVSISAIARKFNVNRATVRKYIFECLPEDLHPQNKAPHKVS